ncbi:MAG: TIGR01440 family protein [Clostridiales bacterium]|nr:TIGR01440 family protein [Clostridiales bacterium]
MYENLKADAERLIIELLNEAKPKKGDVIVIGCSTSEIVGEKIGQGSAPETAQAVLDGIVPHLSEKGLYLAAQCCEHLNRALVVERQLAENLGLEIVFAVPKPKAGGSFAAAAYESMAEPVLVEHIKAAAGMDIGETLIGMHLRDVAVPLRLSVKTLGQARVTAARTRPKLIGGARAQYE